MSKFVPACRQTGLEQIKKIKQNVGNSFKKWSKKKASHLREAFHWLTKPRHFYESAKTTQLNATLIKSSLQI